MLNGGVCVPKIATVTGAVLFLCSCVSESVTGALGVNAGLWGGEEWRKHPQLAAYLG